MLTEKMDENGAAYYFIHKLCAGQRKYICAKQRGPCYMAHGEKQFLGSGV